MSPRARGRADEQGRSGVLARIRRAAPASRRDASTCTTTWSCAPSCTRRAFSSMTAEDRCFSVAKLFFAYGLGNAMTCPFGVGATTILWPGSPAASNVYAVIERHRPTLFFSVPTNYGMLLAHTRDGRRFRSVEHPLRGIGGRGAAAGALRALQAAVRRRDSRRHRFDRDSAHLHLEPPGRDPARARAARSSTATKRASSTNRTAMCPPARSATC